MLDDMMHSCFRSPDSSILFCDEMSSVVRQGVIDPGLVRYLSEETTSKFQDVYLVEITDSLPEDLGVPLEFSFGLDNMEEGSIALNILPMVMKQVSEL